MIPAIVLTALLGLCIGSFLNAAVFRVREDQTVVRGRSKCMKCEEPLDAKDLVPVLSYFILRGRCRRCKSVISWQYPVVELATAALFVVSFLVAGSHLEFVRNIVFVSYLMIIFVYDMRHMLILDKFTIPAMILAVLFNLWLGLIPAWSVLAGGLVLAAFFHLQYKISKGTWVGGGDIRMGAVMGFMLGLQYGLVALFLAYVLGAIVSIYLLAIKRIDRKTPIPFGTFLTIATVAVLFVGNEIIQWYLSFF